MGKRFFKPFIGENYNLGIKDGMKLMILGASHYCLNNGEEDKFNCFNWKVCTSLEKRDSSPFNTTCPYYDGKDYRVLLEDADKEEIENYIEGGDNKSYNNFFNFLGNYFDIKDKNNLCSRIAFTNYVQYFVPTMSTPEQDEKDKVNFEALLETIDSLNPDVIIVWGMEVVNHFHKKYVKSLVNTLKRETDYYFWTLQHKDKIIKIINPYHPCDLYEYWTNNIPLFKEALDKVFNIESEKCC